MSLDHLLIWMEAQQLTELRGLVHVAKGLWSLEWHLLQSYIT